MALGGERQVDQRGVLDLVLAAHLLHEQLRVGHDLQVVHAELGGLGEAGDERAVLGDVVRRDADGFPAGVEHRAVLCLEDVGGGGRARDCRARPRP